MAIQRRCNRNNITSPALKTLVSAAEAERAKAKPMARPAPEHICKFMGRLSFLSRPTYMIHRIYEPQSGLLCTAAILLSLRGAKCDLFSTFVLMTRYLSYAFFT